MSIKDCLIKISEKLDENSDGDGNGRMFVEQISKLTGFSIPVIKQAMVVLWQLKILEIDPAHDINNLDNMIPFQILPNNLKNILGCKHVQ